MCYILQCNIDWGTHIFIQLCELCRYAKVLPLKMFFHVFEFHLQFWQMWTLFANKLYSTNTYFYSPVWIMIVYNNFDAQNLLFICLQISPQIFAILQNFPINNLRDQQFCTLLCELERLVVVLFTALASHLRLRSRQAWCVLSCKQWKCYLANRMTSIRSCLFPAQRYQTVIKHVQFLNWTFESFRAL